MSVDHEYTYNHHDVPRGSKVIDANTPVSMPLTTTELPVRVFSGMLVRLAKANEPVSGV